MPLNRSDHGVASATVPAELNGAATAGEEAPVMRKIPAPDDGATGVSTTGNRQAAGRPVVSAPAAVTCVDYSAGQVRAQEVADLGTFLDHHRPDWSEVRWIDVAGLSDMDVIDALARKYELHPLAIEDLLSRSQRPKIDAYGGEGTGVNARLFITARALQVRDGRLYSDPISVCLGHTTVLTFEDVRSPVWDPVRQRINAAGSRLRVNDASFLVYALLDAVVDACFPIMEHFDDQLDQLEVAVVDSEDRGVLNTIQGIKRQLSVLRSSVWPMREVVSALQRDPHECMSETTKVYLRDLYDHIVQVIEIIETYRERANDLTESYRSAVSFRMNEVMKVLTIIGTIFIPLTFLAGVYGMNFHTFPELTMDWAYPAFWVVCASVVAVMLVLFRRRHWL
jgi:magnesium transporter